MWSEHIFYFQIQAHNVGLNGSTYLPLSLVCDQTINYLLFLSLKYIHERSKLAIYYAVLTGNYLLVYVSSLNNKFTFINLKH